MQQGWGDAVFLDPTYLAAESLDGWLELMEQLRRFV